MLTKTLKTYPLSILCSFAICILSLAPIGAPEVAQDVPFFDKWAHFVMYGGLALVIWFEMIRSKTHHSTSAFILWGIFFPALLGGLMELGQMYLTTYRSGEWMDMLADGIGAMLGSLVGWCIKKKKYLSD